MAKQSAFMANLRAQVRTACDLQRRFTIQQMEDMAVIAYADEYERLHDDEPIPQELAVSFRTAYKETLIDYCEMALDDDAKDGNNDPQLNYTKGKIDQRLEAILGDAYTPWEVRYGDIG